MFSERTQTQACPKWVGPPTSKHSQPAITQKRNQWNRKGSLPYTGRNRLESRKGQHAPIPACLRDSKGIYTRVGYCILLAHHLNFLVGNHRRGNELQGNKCQSELFQLDSWSYLGKHQTYTERVSFCPALSSVQVWVMNLDILETQRILQSRGATAASQAKHQHSPLLC